MLSKPQLLNIFTFNDALFRQFLEISPQSWVAQFDTEKDYFLRIRLCARYQNPIMFPNCFQLEVKLLLTPSVRFDWYQVGGGNLGKEMEIQNSSVWTSSVFKTQNSKTLAFKYQA